MDGLVDFFFWIYFILTENMVYIQIAMMTLLAITAANVLNPTSKTMLVVTFFTLMTLVAKTGIVYVANEITKGSFFMARTTKDFMNLFITTAKTCGMNMQQSTTATEKFMAGVVVTFVIGIYLWKVLAYKKRTRMTYITADRIVTGFEQEKRMVENSFQEEKMMPNSSFEVVRVLPSFQALILASLDGKEYHPMGQCFWVDEGLVTAAHVIEGYQYLSIFRDEDHYIDVSSDIFEVGHGDYAVCREPTKITQKVGLSKAKFSRLAVSKDSGLSVNITAFERRSIGFLQRHTSFGYVQYTGSTTKGFSGAPYYFGKTIFGMHLGAEAANMGYDGAFLKSELKPSRVIKKQLGLEQEDSAEWLIQQFDRYEDFEYSRSPYDPDEYRVRVGGMYHIVDSSVMDTVLSKKPSKKRSDDQELNYLAEAMLTSGATTKTDIAKHQKLAKETDPKIALVQGLLEEWGKASIYQPKDDKKPTVSKYAEEKRDAGKLPLTVRYEKESRDFVEDLPLAPRDAMSFNDSGNLMGAPAVNAGAHGMVNQQVHAPPQNLQTCNIMGCVCRQPLVNYHMESRSSMHAQRSEASARTAKNNRRRLRRQQEKSALAQYLQRYGPIRNGDTTSPPPQTQTSGLTVNLTKP